MEFIVFSILFLGFLVPGAILDASWRSKRHLGPLQQLLKHLERILIALGGLLDHLETILSALEAILAENVAWNLHGTCMERAWNVHGRDLPCARQRAVRRHAVRRARGGGASLKGFDSRDADIVVS